MHSPFRASSCAIRKNGDDNGIIEIIRILRVSGLKMVNMGDSV